MHGASSIDLMPGSSHQVEAMDIVLQWCRACESRASCQRRDPLTRILTLQGAPLGEKSARPIIVCGFFPRAASAPARGKNAWYYFYCINTWVIAPSRSDGAVLGRLDATWAALRPSRFILEPPWPHWRRLELLWSSRWPPESACDAAGACVKKTTLLGYSAAVVSCV